MTPLGPLSVLQTNPRYFTDGSGKAVYLTGSHNWNSLQDGSFASPDVGTSDPPVLFDYVGYLDRLAAWNHNFIRLWRWELAAYAYENGPPRHCAPHPWRRTGPGRALDGKPKFDLMSFDQAYFERLRTRVLAARERNIYVSIMLFEGWGVQFATTGRWQGHPFNRHNNINGVDGDASADGSGTDIHTLTVPKVTAIQEAYVRKVVDTVNDLDNVLYEICNEAGSYSTEWQYHMIDVVKAHEAEKPWRHPVGMTFQHAGGTDDALFQSPADWISPREGYRDDMPPATGDKVVLVDTDHLWGEGGDAGWVWKSFLRGLNPLYMDRLDAGDPVREGARRAMGQTLAYAKRMNLAAMTPRGELASTGYALANPGVEYLVFQPVGGALSLDLRDAPGSFSAEWLDPVSGGIADGRHARGGREIAFTPPLAGGAVLSLKRTP